VGTLNLYLRMPDSMQKKVDIFMMAVKSSVFSGLDDRIELISFALSQVPGDRVYEKATLPTSFKKKMEFCHLMTRCSGHLGISVLGDH
jgi:hypothetical protein